MNWFNRGNCFLLMWLAATLWFCACETVWASAEPENQNEQPLCELIDEQIEAGWKQRGDNPADAAADAEFLRRVCLDLTGMIPTADTARAFLDDDSQDKREQLIDRLLDSPEYALHMARVFDVMLIERRIATIRSYDVPTARWRSYLAASFEDNKPWDQLVREILSSDGTDSNNGPAAKFYLSRDVKPDLLTRDVSRLLLGRDLQCAQCHDDPRYDDYKQTDYYGIYAFLGRLSLFRDNDKKQTLLAEKAEGVVTFTSVFSGMKGETNPRLPGGEMIPDVVLEKGQKYEVAPASGVRAVPRYSRRLQLSQQLPRRETSGFSHNIVNRLWAHMMGRGLVEPLDMHHPKNPPSHPELLDLLAHQFEAMNYDIKSFFREVALSRTYQRASVLPNSAEVSNPSSFAVAPLRALSPEQLAWSLLQSTGRLSAHLDRADQQLKQQDPKYYEVLRKHWTWKKKVYDRFDRDANSVAALFAVMPGNPDGPFAPTVDQALFLLNGDKLSAWLKPDSGTLIDRLAQLQSSDDMADELFLSVFSRRPSLDEIVEVRNHLHEVADGDRIEAIRQLVWGKLLSAEFRLNH